MFLWDLVPGNRSPFINSFFLCSISWAGIEVPNLANFSSSVYINNSSYIIHNDSSNWCNDSSYRQTAWESSLWASQNDEPFFLLCFEIFSWTAQKCFFLLLSSCCFTLFPCLVFKNTTILQHQIRLENVFFFIRIVTLCFFQSSWQLCVVQNMDIRMRNTKISLILSTWDIHHPMNRNSNQNWWNLFLIQTDFQKLLEWKPFTSGCNYVYSIILFIKTNMKSMRQFYFNDQCSTSIAYIYISTFNKLFQFSYHKNGLYNIKASKVSTYISI